MGIFHLIIFLLFLSAITFILRRQEKKAAKRLQKEKRKSETEVGKAAWK